MKEKFPKPSHEEAMAAAAVQISHEIGCKVIIAMTETGKQALYVAKYRPRAEILAVR